MIINIKSPYDISISPDGSKVAYLLSQHRSEGEEPGKKHSELWVVDIASGEQKRFTASPGRSWSPRWSPDGSTIAFLTTRFDDDENAQLHIMPVDGGESEKITDEEVSVRSFSWFPDGRRLAFVVADAADEEVELAEEEGRDWTVVDSTYRHRRLWEIDINNKEKKLLTVNDVTVHDFDISPDGERIALLTADTPRTDDSYMFKKLTILDTRRGKMSLLHDPEAKIERPSWSPDGKLICYNGGVDISDPSWGSLFVISAKGGEPRNLTEGFAGTVTWTGRWASERIAFVAVTGTATALYSIRKDGSGMEKLIGQTPVFTAISLSKDRKHLAARASTPLHPSEVFYAQVGSREMKRLTWNNPEIERVRLPKQEVIRWQARDGLEIEGILIKPLDYEEGKRYPLVIKVHGGPEAAYLDRWNFYYSGMCLMASRDFVVFLPNYRGSTGRGVEYAKADHKDLGGKEFTDILDGIDYLAERGMIDPERVGIGGGSYGGYMSALAATKYSERFKAAVVFAGISNWNSFIGTSDIPYENSLVHWNLWSYDEPELCWDRSALGHIRKAGTPVLIIHGEEDRRVPISQAEELYTAFRVQGTPVKFVRYPRAGHGLGEREHQMDFMLRTLNWFETHLK
jgi:dipeptidyl aminopeptidase/acylaminoacyl peptidase